LLYFNRMKYTIECSYGEIIDKISILQIKLENVNDIKKQENISKEYESLKKWIRPDDGNVSKFLNDLYIVNKKLWDLENTIRVKSTNKIYDKSYIECAENIHINNDIRYYIKSQINNIYESYIKEEKIYTSNTLTSNDKVYLNTTEANEMSIEDINLFDAAIKYYYTGYFIQSFNIISILCEKYSNYKPTDKIINLFFCMELACCVTGNVNVYENKIHEYINIIDNVIKNNEAMLHHFKIQYAHLLLKKNNFIDSKKYAKYINTVTSKGGNINIHFETMDYFKEDDINKTLLIYTSGGVGDKIMYNRFIKRVCETNKNNNVLFIIDDSLYWIYRDIYKDTKNIKVINHSNSHIISHFDYHINITMLLYYLGITYESLYVDYYLINLPESNICLKDVIDPVKLNVVINWHGNYENICEKYNRGMELQNMIPLFENEFLQNINWISVQKEVNQEEINILEKYKVKNLYNKIDNSGDAFKDTITILKKVDLVISTDTSLVHIASTMEVKCWTLLTMGCDWRWGKENTCLWYPNMKMIRQKNIRQWDSVINTVINDLYSIVK